MNKLLVAGCSVDGEVKSSDGASWLGINKRRGVASYGKGGELYLEVKQDQQFRVLVTKTSSVPASLVSASLYIDGNFVDCRVFNDNRTTITFDGWYLDGNHTYKKPFQFAVAERIEGYKGPPTEADLTLGTIKVVINESLQVEPYLSTYSLTAANSGPATTAKKAIEKGVGTKAPLPHEMVGPITGQKPYRFKAGRFLGETVIQYRDRCGLMFLDIIKGAAEVPSSSSSSSRGKKDEKTWKPNPSDASSSSSSSSSSSAAVAGAKRSKQDGNSSSDSQMKTVPYMTIDNSGATRHWDMRQITVVRNASEWTESRDVLVPVGAAQTMAEPAPKGKKANTSSSSSSSSSAAAAYADSDDSDDEVELVAEYDENGDLVQPDPRAPPGYSWRKFVAAVDGGGLQQAVLRVAVRVG